jgi:hypothetical protein
MSRTITVMSTSVRSMSALPQAQSDSASAHGPNRRSQKYPLWDRSGSGTNGLPQRENCDADRAELTCWGHVGGSTDRK